MKNLVCAALMSSALALTGWTGTAHAQAQAAHAYPDKPITIVVAYPPGGDTDLLARLFAEKLSPRLGKPVVVDNRTGASGIIGSSFVSKAAPDGYTLLLAPNTFSIAQLVLKTGGAGGYDVLNGFTPIIKAGTTSLFLVAGPATGAKTFNELRTTAASQPMGYASPGSGSPMHILGELVNKATGARFEHVPYKGVAPAVNDVVGGHVAMTYITLGSVAPYLAGGKLVNLAVADAQRSPLAPQVPTFQELGYKDVVVTAWYGLFGPKGMPPEVVKLLNEHLNEILKMPDIVARMAALGTVPVGGTPQTLGQTNAADHERFGKIIKDLGIRAD